MHNIPDMSGIGNGDSNVKNFVIVSLIIVFIGSIGVAVYLGFNWDKVHAEVEKYKQKDIEEVEVVSEKENDQYYFPCRTKDAVPIEVFYNVLGYVIEEEDELEIRKSVREYLYGIMCSDLLGGMEKCSNQMSNIVKTVLDMDVSIDWYIKFPDYIFEMREKYLVAEMEKKAELLMAEQQVEIEKAEEIASEIRHKVAMDELAREREKKLYEIETEKMVNDKVSGRK